MNPFGALVYDSLFHSPFTIWFYSTSLSRWREWYQIHKVVFSKVETFILVELRHHRWAMHRSLQTRASSKQIIWNWWKSPRRCFKISCISFSHSLNRLVWCSTESHGPSHKWRNQKTRIIIWFHEECILSDSLFIQTSIPNSTSQRPNSTNPLFILLYL